MSLYMLDLNEEGEVTRTDPEGKTEKMVKDSGGHEWEEE